MPEKVIGRRLSHFEITARLGKGGMGEVYLAHDLNLDRDVALKVLPPELADDTEHLTRLVREAKALAALDHPNIVTVFSVEEADGVRFLTMAYVEGRSLDAVIPDGGLTIAQLLDFAVPLADALRAAHERGIVHRDLKPTNIIVDNEGRLRVLDFGLAKRELPAAEVGQATTRAFSGQMTREGTILGSYPYMSPEQAEGRLVDGRSDLFSLGIVLYEMACGQRPFAGSTGVSLITAILRDTPAPLGERRPDLPQRFVEIVSRCLEKDRNRRYGSALDLRNDLDDLRRALASGLAGPASEVRARWDTAPITPRSRARVVTAAALAVMALAAGIFYWSRWSQEPAGAQVVVAPDVPFIAVLPLRNMTGDPEQDYFVDGMTEALITDLSKIGGLRVIARSSAMRYRDTEKSIPEISAELGVGAIVEGSVIREGDRVGITAQLINPATNTATWSNRYERDLTSVLAIQSDIARAIAGEIHVALTPEEATLLSADRTADPRAYEAYLKGMFHLRRFTPQDLEAALQLFENAIAIDPSYALPHYGVSQVWNYSFVLGVEQPLEAGPKALAAVKQALTLDGSLAEAHLGLANIKTSFEWDWQGAEAAFERAIEINPNYAEARVFYSHLLLILGRIEEGQSQIERALELDPFEPFFRAAFGVFLGYTGRQDEAITVFRETFENVPGFGFAHQPAWRVFHSVGRLDEAVEQARIHLTTVGEAGAVTALDRGLAEGGYREAMRQAAETLAAGSRLAKARPIIIADLYDDAGETDKALEWIEHAYELRDIDIAYLGALLLSEDVRRHQRFQRVLDRLGTPLLAR
ncbi:MAG TPA: protein kinase [Vicinamibacterales bacterium]|nr:protein kinase [Vicinamibacterales bacterium]